MVQEKINALYNYAIGFPNPAKKEKIYGWVYGIFVGIKVPSSEEIIYNPREVLEIVEASKPHERVYHIFGSTKRMPEVWKKGTYSPNPFLFVNDAFARIGAGIPCKVKQKPDTEYQNMHIVGVNNQALQDALTDYQHLILTLFENSDAESFGSRVTEKVYEMYGKLYHNCFTISKNGTTSFQVGIDDIMLPPEYDLPKQDKQDKKSTISSEIQRLEHQREEKAQMNVTSDILIEEVIFNNVEGFGGKSKTDFKFKFQAQPIVNLILGKNGHSKTEFLRFLTMALLNEPENKQHNFLRIFHNNSNIKISLTKNEGETQLDNEYKLETNGEGAKTIVSKKETRVFPVLSIQDNRFFKKDEFFRLTYTEGSKKDIYTQYMTNFIAQDNPEHLFVQVLTRIYDDQKTFEENNLEAKLLGKKCSFVLFLTEIIRELTDDKHFEFYDIRDTEDAFRKGDYKQITVKSLYNLSNEPVSIQKASRGTLGVLYIFGAIYNFIKNAYPDASFSEARKKPAIVIIDEIDAHLHPDWQRKIVSLLRKSFPNVQYFLTAHSPLCAMGCIEGEVTVFRSNTEDKVVYADKINRHLIKRDIEDVFEDLFEIEPQEVFIDGEDDADNMFEFERKELVPVEVVKRGGKHG
jgi:hypothetical protein